MVSPYPSAIAFCIALTALAPATAQEQSLLDENDSAERPAVPAPAMKDKFGAGHVVGFAPPAQQPAMAALAQEAGVRLAREDFAWSSIELTPGSYSFAGHDTFVNNAVAGGLQVVGQLSYTPQFYSSNPTAPNYLIFPTTTAQGLNAWSNFVSATVLRYRDRVRLWQIWPNVDDYAVWGGSTTNPRVADYLNLLTRAHAAIKAADPGATVVTAGMDPPFLSAMLDLGGAPFFDAIGVHGYVVGAPESSVMDMHTAAIRDLSQRRAGGKPLWVTEYGWPTTNPLGLLGVTETTQAAYVVRSMLWQGRHRDVRASIWTDFRNEPTGGVYNPDADEDNYGMLLRTDLSKKLSFDSYKAMTTALGNAGFLRNHPPAPTLIQVMDDFEGSRSYQVFPSGGGTGSFARAFGVANTLSFSGAVSYAFPTPASAIVVAPLPSFFVPVSGVPTRFRLWARNDGGLPITLQVNFQDATGENFGAVLGAVEGTQWREYTYYLDVPFGSSFIITSSGGNNDKRIDYPIRFNGLTVYNFSAIIPRLGNGVVYVDDMRFESGPTVFDFIHRGTAATVHAVWSLAGTPTVSIPTRASGATVRDWRNVTSFVGASGGAVTVTASSQPLWVNVLPDPNPFTTGVFRPSNGILFLKNTNTTGFADLALAYGLPGDVPVTGDWDGDGIETIGIFRNGTFFLRNSNTNGLGEIGITFGASGDQVVAGDWNGDGVETIGIFRNGTFYLRNTNASGPVDIAFTLGIPGDIAVAGDWNGDGITTLGVFRPSSSTFFLKNSIGPANDFVVVPYAVGTDKPIVGDWNGDGIDSIGIFRDGTFALRDSNTPGAPDYVFTLGIPGDVPMAGDWNGLP